jgi:bacterioferritin-associated ferredoxin
MDRGAARSLVFAIDFHSPLPHRARPVHEAHRDGTAKQVAEVRGAGSQRGSCRRTIRAVISSSESLPTESDRGCRG